EEAEQRMELLPVAVREWRPEDDVRLPGLERQQRGVDGSQRHEPGGVEVASQVDKLDGDVSVQLDRSLLLVANRGGCPRTPGGQRQRRGRIRESRAPVTKMDVCCTALDRLPLPGGVVDRCELEGRQPGGTPDHQVVKRLAQ